MSKPNFVVTYSEKTQGGALLTAGIQQIRQCLLNHGFILLPSDTCYSIAVLALNKNTKDRVNTLLSRKKEPISLAFPNFERVDKWVNLNTMIAVLLEKFTPGPITVVCDASQKLPVAFTTQVIDSKTRTIGVRIPDSIVEREVAACTQFLTTTAAVRNPKDGTIVQDFEEAVKIVGKGMGKIGNPGWGAIEGGRFYAKHSTVVQVTDEAERLKLIREGDISFEDIKTVSDNLPIWATEDWL